MLYEGLDQTYPHKRW